jgi:hypothetical protein
MDSLITAAARALAAGHPLAALNRVALRDDPPALALRGMRWRGSPILIERRLFPRARRALVSRDLGWTAKALAAARQTLDAHGDHVNAAHARHLEVRRLLLIGRRDEAERALAGLDPAPFPPASIAAYELVVARIAMRRVRAKGRALRSLGPSVPRGQAGIPALMVEVESVSQVLVWGHGCQVGSSGAVESLTRHEIAVAEPIHLPLPHRQMLRIGARRDLRIEMAARQRPGHEPLRLELIKVPVVGEEIE